MKVLSLSLFWCVLFLSRVTAFLSQLPRRQKLALMVTKRDMMDAPSRPSTEKPSRPKGNKAKRKAKAAAAAAIADEINGKTTPKKKAATN